MRENLTPESIASDIHMRRSQFKGTFLIVEGDTDQRFYGRFIDEELCQTVAANGKPSAKQNAIRVIEILRNENFDGALAIVDADFSRLEGKEPDNDHIFMTDTHDLETIILKSPALETLLAEYGSKQKIENITKSRNKGIRQMLLEIGIQIGYLRWVSEKKNLALKFEEINFLAFVDVNNLTLKSVIQMIVTVINNSSNQNLEADNLQEQMSKLYNPNNDPWDICCGHDLVCILSIGLHRVFGSGSNKARDVSIEQIEKYMRMSYEEAYFLATQLYKSLRSWENINHPFRIFKLSFNQ